MFHHTQPLEAKSIAGLLNSQWIWRCGKMLQVGDTITRITAPWNVILQTAVDKSCV